MKTNYLKSSDFKKLCYFILTASTAIFFGACKDTKKLEVELVNPKPVSPSPKAETYDMSVALEWNELHLSLLKNNPSLTSLSAARSLGYVNLALYESIVHGTDKKSLSGRLNGFANVPQAVDSLEYNWGLAANVAQCTMIQSLFPKATVVERTKIDALLSKYEKAFAPASSQVVIKRSIEYGAAIANAVWNYSRRDGLNGSDSLLFDNNYLFPDGLGVWKPEPSQTKPLLTQWTLLRPMILSNKFLTTAVSVPFSYRKESAFFSEALKIYQASKNLTSVQKEKSSYWVGSELGNNAVHNVFNVLSSAVKRKNLRLDKAAIIYLKGSIVVFDGSIAVWRNKFETNLIRPDTYIKEAIDKSWKPLHGNSYSPAFPSLTATLAGGIGKLIMDELGGSILTPMSGSPMTVADFKSEIIAAEVAGGTNFAFSAEGGFKLGEKIVENTIGFDF